MQTCPSLSCLPPMDPDNDGRAITTLPRLERKLKYCYTAAIVVDSVKVLIVQGSFSSGKHE